MFEAIQIILVIVLVSASLALVWRQAVLYSRWRKGKTNSRPKQ